MGMRFTTFDSCRLPCSAFCCRAVRVVEFLSILAERVVLACVEQSAHFFPSQGLTAGGNWRAGVGGKSPLVMRQIFYVRGAWHNSVIRQCIAT